MANLEHKCVTDNIYEHGIKCIHFPTISTNELQFVTLNYLV